MRGAVQALAPSSRLGSKLSRTFLGLQSGFKSIYLDNFAVFSRAEQSKLLTPAAADEIGDSEPYDEFEPLLSGTVSYPPLNRMLYVDIKTYLHELLMRQDQMSMSASLEARVPFLDHKLVEYVAGLPERMKLRGRTTKYLLRQCMGGDLPNEILRRRKVGFPVPFGKWARGVFQPLIDELVLSQRAQERALFDRETVRQLIDEHTSGRIDHSAQLWALVNLEIWFRTCIEGEGPRSSEYEDALSRIGADSAVGH